MNTLARTAILRLAGDDEQGKQEDRGAR